MSAPRIGVLRPTRVLPVVAEADARVIRWELERRVGPVTLDLRIDGDALGPWQPLEHAAWPGDIDARLDAGELWNADDARLCGLLVRTIEPDAASVRADMLRHLGVVPLEPFVLDDELLADLDPRRVLPTDLWLVARAADEVTVDDPDVRSLAGLLDPARLDAAFDRVASELVGQPAVDEAVGRHAARLAQERDELRRRLDDLERDTARHAADMRGRFAELGNELHAWRERAERAELGNGAGP